jgi:hypothetical protein
MIDTIRLWFSAYQPTAFAMVALFAIVTWCVLRWIQRDIRQHEARRDRISPHSRAQFVLTVEAVFAESPLGLDKWLTAVANKPAVTTSRSAAV